MTPVVVWLGSGLVLVAAVATASLRASLRRRERRGERRGESRGRAADVAVLDALADALAAATDAPAVLDPWEHAVAAVRAPREPPSTPAARPGAHEPDAPPGALLAALGRVRSALAAATVPSGPVPAGPASPAGRADDLHGAVTRGFSEALAAGHLSVSFQPTVSLAGSTVVGAEALARWEHPELGSLPPEDFVPVLEATGRIGDLTVFVLDRALAAVRAWLDRGLGLGVAVNVPVAMLADAAFPDTVAAALAEHGVPADLLTLELTESGVSSDRPAAVPVVRSLRELGCRIAVDDFGTGQSSLAHLRGLPVDQLKIDKSFVLGMDGEPGRALVRAIVEMGHSLGLTVVAEGVECVADRDVLAALGCDVAQGYLVSGPLPAGRLDRWLADLSSATGDPAGPTAWGPRPLRVTGAV